MKLPKMILSGSLISRFIYASIDVPQPDLAFGYIDDYKASMTAQKTPSIINNKIAYNTAVDSSYGAETGKGSMYFAETNDNYMGEGW